MMQRQPWQLIPLVSGSLGPVPDTEHDGRSRAVPLSQQDVSCRVVSCCANESHLQEQPSIVLCLKFKQRLCRAQHPLPCAQTPVSYRSSPRAAWVMMGVLRQPRLWWLFKFAPSSQTIELTSLLLQMSPAKPKSARSLVMAETWTC